MDYKIVEKQSFNVIGKSVRVSMKDGNNFVQIPDFWRRSFEDGTVSGLEALGSPDSVTGGITLGVYLDAAPDMSEFTYMIGVEHAEALDGWTSVSIPASTWAIFEANPPQPEGIRNIWKNMSTEFFSIVPYTQGKAPGLVVYPKRDASDNNYSCEAWVSVVPE